MWAPVGAADSVGISDGLCTSALSEVTFQHICGMASVSSSWIPAPAAKESLEGASRTKPRDVADDSIISSGVQPNLSAARAPATSAYLASGTPRGIQVPGTSKLPIWRRGFMVAAPASGQTLQNPASARGAINRTMSIAILSRGRPDRLEASLKATGA